MTDLPDLDFDTFLDCQPMTYRNDSDVARSLEIWPSMGVLEPQSCANHAGVNAQYLSDIDHIYGELHKCVDQVMSNISFRTPSRLAQIREQNRKLIDKLENLETAINVDTRTASVSTSYFSSGSPASSFAGTEATSVMTSPPSTPKERQASPLTMSEVIPVEQHGQQHPLQSGGRLSLSTFKENSKLAKKLMQVGSPETIMQVADFAVRLRTPQYRYQDEALPHGCRQFSQNSSIETNDPQFLQLIANLGLAIESSIFGEQNSRIRKRIALAHFYHAYTLAQDHPEMFLSWWDDQHVQSGSLLPKGGHKSIVQQRFADLIFSRPGDRSGEIQILRPPSSGDDTKRRIAKIQTWRKSGKKWAQFIQRFGYGILLLLPTSVCDEDLRVASDEIIAYGLDLIDSRKHSFTNVLQQANILLEAHFFPHEDVAQLSSARNSDHFEQENWNELLKMPIL